MVKKIKTKHGYKIKYPNGTTAYFYPHGTGKRKTKNSAYTGPVKYFHIQYGPNEYTGLILKYLYTAGLNINQTRGAYNNFFKQKIDKTYIKKQYKRLNKLKIKKYTNFKQEIINDKEGTTLSVYKRLNKIVRTKYLESALIKTSNGISRLNIFYKQLNKKGITQIDEFLRFNEDELEGSP